MAKALFVRSIGGLRAADDAAEEMLSRWKVGEIRQADVTKPRNLKAHRKFWVLIGLVFRNQEFYPSREALADVVKIGTGHVEPLTLPDGTVWMRPKSISFTSQDDIEFQAFFERAVTFITTRLLPSWDRAELIDEVDELMR